MTIAPVRLPRTRRRDPEPPAHLSRSSKALWRSVLVEYELARHEMTVLAAALESRDRMDQARDQIKLEGLTVEGRFGPKQHPAVAIERDSRLAMIRAWRALKLPGDPPRGRTVARWSGS